MTRELKDWYRKTLLSSPFISQEAFYRILILYFGINYNFQKSFQSPDTNIEAVFSCPSISSIPLLTLLRPESPFSLVDSGTTNHKVLLYKNKYVSESEDYSQTIINLNQKEPFYFFVKEINGEVVLKINPIQLCDFYNKEDNNSPCAFCFRNNNPSKYRNIKAEKLLTLINREDSNFFKQLSATSEISINTGTFDSDDEFVKEIKALVIGIKKLAPKNSRITIGSHELKKEKDMQTLKKAGVTDLAFPLEIFSNSKRQLLMNNRKGKTTINNLLTTLKSAIATFGPDRVIVRVIAGLNDPINEVFKQNVEKIRRLGKNKQGPKWNINIYMPFTYFQFTNQKQNPEADLNYLFNFCSIISRSIPVDRFIRFKISP